MQKHFCVNIDQSYNEYVATAHDKRKEGAEGLLGFIRHSKATGIVELTNFKACLNLEDLKFGYSTKRGNKNLAGRHGEGLKIASLVMTRNRHRVRIESGKFYWSFGYRKEDQETLSCRLSPIIEPKIRLAMEIERKRIAEGSPRGPTSNSWEDVTVVIGRIQGIGEKVESEEFEDWLRVSLDLHPPKKVIETSYGSLILDHEYHGRVYLNGLTLAIHNLLEKSMEADTDEPEEALFRQYRYGYNLLRGEVNREREALKDSIETRDFTKIWTEAIIKYPADTLKLFVDMLQEDDLCADVCHAKHCITNDVAKAIWQHLQGEESQRQVFYHGNTNIDRVRIIC